MSNALATDRFSFSLRNSDARLRLDALVMGIDPKIRIAAPLGAAVLVLVAGVISLSQEPAYDAPATAALGDGPTPGGAPQIAQNQTGSGGVDLGVEIVVKFKDDAPVKEICDTFWRDANAARQQFDSKHSEWPAFAELALDRVTYSNELVLVSRNNASPDAMRAIARDIQAMSAIAYAEPNSTAHPGDGR